MLRQHLHDILDRALVTRRIIVIQGLPRVGRSELVRRWSQSRDDVIAGSLTDTAQTGGVLVFDHLARSQADQLVERIRAAEAAGDPSRFIALPLDLSAAHHVRTALAGSVDVIEVSPLQLEEYQAERTILSTRAGPTDGLSLESVATNAQPFDPDMLWLRGGLPESLEAETDGSSLAFRRRLLQDLFARDYSEWHVPRAAPLEDILRWLANQNGGELDETTCPLVKRQDLRSVLHVFERLGLIRRLPNFPAGQSASFSRLQKVHLCDSGLLHAVLGVETIPQLRSGDAVGDSFETFAIETLIRASDGMAVPQFYRADTGSGMDELDLVLDFGNSIGRMVAIELKVNPNTRPRPGFYRARDVIQATDAFVVHSGATLRDDDKVERLDLASAVQRVSEIARP